MFQTVVTIIINTAFDFDHCIRYTKRICARPRTMSICRLLTINMSCVNIYSYMNFAQRKRFCRIIEQLNSDLQLQLNENLKFCMLDTIKCNEQTKHFDL